MFPCPNNPLRFDLGLQSATDQREQMNQGSPQEVQYGLQLPAASEEYWSAELLGGNNMLKILQQHTQIAELWISMAK